MPPDYYYLLGLGNSLENLREPDACFSNQRPWSACKQLADPISCNSVKFAPILWYSRSFRTRLMNMGDTNSSVPFSGPATRMDRRKGPWTIPSITASNLMSDDLSCPLWKSCRAWLRARAPVMFDAKIMPLRSECNMLSSIRWTAKKMSGWRGETAMTFVLSFPVLGYVKKKPSSVERIVLALNLKGYRLRLAYRPP